MDLWNLGTSLGIGGLIAIGFYKIAVMIIRVWTSADAARTQAFKEGNAQLVTALGTGFASMHDSFASIIQKHYEGNAELMAAITDARAKTAEDLDTLARQVNSLDIHVSNANGFTPPPQMAPLPPNPPPRMTTTTVSAAMISATVEDEVTPIDRPPVSRTATPTQRAKSQPIVSGEYTIGPSKPNKVR